MASQHIHKLIIEAQRGPHTNLSLQWRHNGQDGVSNYQPHDCLLNRLFKRISKETSKFRATGLCAGISPVPGEFPAQMASNAVNVSIRWGHHHWGPDTDTTHEFVIIGSDSGLSPVRYLPRCQPILRYYLFLQDQACQKGNKLYIFIRLNLFKMPSSHYRSFPSRATEFCITQYFSCP